MCPHNSIFVHYSVRRRIVGPPRKIIGVRRTHGYYAFERDKQIIKISNSITPLTLHDTFLHIYWSFEPDIRIVGPNPTRRTTCKWLAGCKCRSFVIVICQYQYDSVTDPQIKSQTMTSHFTFYMNIIFDSYFDHSSNS